MQTSTIAKTNPSSFISDHLRIKLDVIPKDNGEHILILISTNCTEQEKLNSMIHLQTGNEVNVGGKTQC